MTQDDCIHVAALEAASTPSSWSCAMFQDDIRLGSYCRILEDASAVRMGYIVARLQLDEWHVLILGIAPQFRRLGGARLLLNGLFDQATSDASRTIMLEVRASNKPAITLYQDMGFNFLYTRKAYYRLGLGTEDAIVLDYRFAKENV